MAKLNRSKNLFTSQLLISRKFKVDVGTNVASLVFLGIAGVIINVLIVRFYGAQALGVYNEVYAIYIIVSQFAAFSVHLSVQKYLSEKPKKNVANQITTSSLLLVLVFSTVIAFIIYFSKNLWGLWFHNGDVSRGIGLTAFGLIGFALNKTLLAVLNGHRAMKAFAFFQSLRYFLILSFLTTAIFFKWPAWILPGSLSFAEATTFIILFSYTIRYFKITFKLHGWLKKHLIFGYHALAGNVLVDVNTRVDVIILGFFTTTTAVGIYSFAAAIAEGFYQLLMVLKNNVNPILSRMVAQKNKPDLKKFIHRGIRLTYQFFTLLALLAIILYPIGLKLLVGNQNLTQSWLVFTFLLAGLTLSAGYQPFQSLLVQVGFPKYYSLLVTIIFLTNVIFNLILVPSLGIYGSAIATSISFIISAVTLKLLTWKALRIKI